MAILGHTFRVWGGGGGTHLEYGGQSLSSLSAAVHNRTLRSAGISYFMEDWILSLFNGKFGLKITFQPLWFEDEYNVVLRIAVALWRRHISIKTTRHFS